MDLDVTDKVKQGNWMEEETLPITQCACGKSFLPLLEILSIYRDDPWECPDCKRKLYFSVSVRVWEVNNPVSANQLYKDMFNL